MKTMTRRLAALALVLALTACDEGTTEPDPDPPRLLGDVTGDGIVDVRDAQQIARWSLGEPVAYPIGEPLICQ